jgi:hypothetical protein
LNDTRLGGLPALIVVVGRTSTEDFRPLIADGFLALGTKDSIVVAASSFASTVRNGVAMVIKNQIQFQRTNERSRVCVLACVRGKRLLRTTRRAMPRRSAFGASRVGV